MEFKFFSYFLILILIMGYRFGLRKSLLISGALSIFIILYYRSVPIYSKLIILFVFDTIPFITFGFRKKSSEYKEKVKGMLEEVRISYDRLSLKDKSQLQLNLDIERKVEKIAQLYEVSKELSTGLSFEEIFKVLCKDLKKSFRFQRAALLIEKEDIDELGEAYILEREKDAEQTKPDEFEIEVFNIVKAIKGPLLLSGKKEDSYFAKLSNLKNFETLAAVPLSIEGKILAILYMEGLTRDYFDNFLILASQFAIHLERIFLYNRVEEMAITDSLTGVHTRRHLMERFKEEIRRSMKHKSPLSVLILDIDNFKDRNDRFGHLVGDVILRDIGRLLKSNLREIDIIGRYGGEEFVMVLSNTPKKGARGVAERIRQTIGVSRFKAYDEIVDVTASLGISGFPEDGVDAEGLIDCADRALYRAKETGRNKVVIYE